MPHTDLFGPSFPPGMLPSAYPFAEHVGKAYPQTEFGLGGKPAHSPAATPPGSGLLLASSPSRTPPRSPSDSGSESAPEEVRSAFVPIRLGGLPLGASSSSPERPARRPAEGTRCELKAPTALISHRTSLPDKRSPSPTKIQAPPAAKPVWRPY